MAVKQLMVERPTGTLKFYNDLVKLRTQEPLQFIDLSELVAERVRRSGIAHGLVNVQVRHTTAAVLVNENEPRLLDDITDLLARLAPKEAAYHHDDFEARPVSVPAGERPNGHAHLRATLLGSSACLNVVDGEVQLGKWQSVFLVELDGARKRSVSINVIGLSRG